jgi:hypothetical protein
MTKLQKELLEAWLEHTLDVWACEYMDFYEYFKEEGIEDDDDIENLHSILTDSSWEVGITK